MKEKLTTQFKELLNNRIIIYLFFILCSTHAYSQVDTMTFRIGNHIQKQGLNDSLYCFIKQKNIIVERLIFDSLTMEYDTEPTQIIFEVTFDTNLNKYIGIWKSLSNYILQEGEFDLEGNADGTFTERFRNSVTTANYSNGKKNGIEICKIDSTYLMVDSYKDGLKHGVSYMVWYGGLHYLYEYKDGKIHGKTYSFDRDEMGLIYILQVRKYKEGKLRNGYDRMLYPNGRTFTKLFYWNNKPIGRKRVYDERGKLIKKVDPYLFMLPPQSTMHGIEIPNKPK